MRLHQIPDRPGADSAPWQCEQPDCQVCWLYPTENESAEAHKARLVEALRPGTYAQCAVSRLLRAEAHLPADGGLMTARCFLPAHPPAIALAVHRATDLGSPEHRIGQGFLTKRIEMAIKESEKGEGQG